MWLMDQLGKRTMYKNGMYKNGLPVVNEIRSSISKRLLGDLPQRIKTRGFAAELMRCGRLVGPILLGQSAQMFAPLIDTVMAGRVGPEDLSAVALGNALWVAVLLFGIGLLSVIQALAANAFGARRYEDILPLMQAGCVIAVGLTLTGLGTVQLAPSLLAFSDATPKLVTMASQYYEGLGYGMLPCFLLFAARGYCEGLGNTRIFMLLWCFMALINIPINASLIYGYGPIPALGGVGCGYATAIVNWIGLFIFVVWSHRRQLFNLASWGVDHLTQIHVVQMDRLWQALMMIFRLGLPSAFHLLVEGSMFSGMAVLVAVFGAEVIAANQIALNITSFLFMIPLSFSFAYTIRIAHQRGAGELALVAAVAKSSIWVVAILGLTLGLFTLYFAEFVVSLYTDDASVINLATMMLVVGAFYKILDIAQVIWVGILKGFEDTKIPMWITIFALLIVGLPVGFMLARTSVFGPPMGAIGLWFGILIGLMVSSLLLFMRLHYILKNLMPEVGGSAMSQHSLPTPQGV